MSLLNRAKKMREPEGDRNVSSENDIVFDESSGISEEDQKDILSQIDKISRKNRISASADLLVVKANKRGFILPFAVNIAALVLSVLGFLTLSAFFKQSELELRGTSSAIRSAEGKLIQEIKKETEARLRAKEQEIDSIQNRLREIDNERNDLQANMDARVKQREDELRKAVAAELAEERRKLSAQGLSEAAIEERMKKLENERNAEFADRLASFRREAEEEKAKLEANLKKLQNDFQANLAGLNAERLKITEESRKKEDALKAQLDEKTRAFETERTKSQAELTRAESELKTLSEQKEKSTLVEGQILGFYSSVKTSLNEGNYEKAKEYLTSLKRYLNEDGIRNLPGIEQRREADITIADAFINMIDESLRGQREKQSIASAMQTGAVVDEIRKTVEQAQAAAAAGNLAEAEGLYTEALGKVPEVLASHEYFIKKRQTAEENRRKSFETAIARAEGAYKAGKYREAIDGYTQAMSFVSGGEMQAGAFLQNVQKSGYEILLAEQKNLESKNAGGLLMEGREALKTSRYPQAVAAFVTLLQRYPLSSQSRQAIDGIRQAADEQNALLLNRESSATSTVASLQSEKAAVERALQTRITSLENQVADLKRQNEKSALIVPAPVPAPIPAPVPAPPPIPTIPPETQEELKRLEAVEKELTRLRDIYKDYTAKEDGTLRSKGEDGIVEAKFYLDSFLASETIRKNFPDFDVRIKRYDQAFLEAGRNEALMEAADIAYRLSSFTSKKEIDSYIANQLQQKKGNELMTDYLNNMKRIVR